MSLLIFYYSFFEDFKTVEFRDKTMSWNICWTQRCRPLFEGKKTVEIDLTKLLEQVSNDCRKPKKK